MNPTSALSTLEAPALRVETVYPSLTSARFYYMDSMRSILMMLGVVLHGSLIYSTGDQWIISDSHQSNFFYGLSSTIYAFRMPTFFIIAGFFSMMSLKKYGSVNFTKIRLLRILPPLLFTAILINSLELYVSIVIIQQHPMSVTHFLTHELPQKWIAGGWISHLWFLLTLLQFFVVGIGFYLLGTKFSSLNFQHHILGSLRKNCYFLLLLPSTQLAWIIAAKLSPDIFQGSLFCGLFNIEEFFVYIPYFLVGLWLYQDELMQQEFHSFARWEWYALALSIVTQFFFSNVHGLNPSSFLRIYTASLIWALSSHLYYVLFFKFMNRNSQVFRYLSDASYSIYLFHHLCVVIFGYLLLESEIAICYKFLTIEIATLSITLAIHHFLILNSRTLRFMFNGKWR